MRSIPDFDVNRVEIVCQCRVWQMPIHAQETKTHETLTFQDSISHGEFAQTVLETP